MLVLEMFTWWYGPGWKAAAQNITKGMTGVSRLFSIPILIRTLFAPWKRIISYPGASLDAKLRAYGDNIVSRAVGFTVRFLALLTALLVALVVAGGSTIVCIVWPLVPPAAILFIIRSFV
jgi:hypothetical protein